MDQSQVAVMFNDDIVANTIPDTRLGIPAPKLRGRCTWVIPATSSSNDPRTKSSLHGKNLVIKANWIEKSRLNEADVIRFAYEKLHSKQETNGLENHIPNLISSREMVFSDTALILERLNVNPSLKQKPRILRLHLFPYLIPVDELSGEEEFIKTWLDCFKCHYALWKLGIEHGDISMWNLMWEPTEECGILNDWDQAHVRGCIPCKGGAVKKEWEPRGTLPFNMARDILKHYFSEPTGTGNLPSNRLYRHDVESFIWIFIWRCHTKSEHGRKMLEKWYTGTPKAIYAEKSSYIFESDHFQSENISDEMWQRCELLCSILYLINHARRFNIDFEPADECIHQIVLDIIDRKITEGRDIKIV